MMGGETPLLKPATGLRKGRAAWHTMVLGWKAATRGEKLIDLTTWVAIGILLSYIFSMVAWPLFSSDFDWAHVQRVWHSWQTLNAGMIALASSLLAFHSARYSNRQRRKYEHIAAVAFLPRALSDLTGYFEQSAKLLSEVYYGQRGESLNECALSLPHGYEEVFYRCIVGADNDLAGYLSSVLNKLQIHHSRISSLRTASDGTGTVVRQGIITLMVHLAEIHAMVGNLFDYARCGSRSYRNALDRRDYLESCGILQMHPRNIRGMSDIIDGRVREYDPMKVT